MTVIVVLLIGTALAGARDAPEPFVALETGDLVFQSSSSRQAAGIEQATGSPYSHVGIIKQTESGPVVIEAVEPVRSTPWRTWWRRGRQHRVTVLRVHDLPPADAKAAVTAAESYLGRHYDAQFDWDDQRIYCSELIEKAFQRGVHLTLGHMQKLGTLRLAGLEGPLRERFGGRVPLDREIITPAGLAADPRLDLVFSSFP